MDSATILLVLLAMGVNFGWKPAEDSTDGYEYIVQVEPELLDALKRGDSVPIESNVPPEVWPIRKVSLVVGRGELPRDTVSTVERTAYFAGQGGSMTDRFGSTPSTGRPASAYDRYGQLPGATASGVGPPPSVLDRAQAAVTETGTALRDGVEAGIQAANHQFSRAGEQVLDATQNAGQEFGRQLQGMASDPVGQLQSNANSLRSTTEQALGAAGNQRPPVTNPFAAAAAQPAASGTQTSGGVAPPPWPQAGSQTLPPSTDTVSPEQTAAPGMTPLRTESGWTSIGTNVAAPPLIIPPLTATPTGNAGPQTRTATSGPSFPAFGGLNRDASGSTQFNESIQNPSVSDSTTDWADVWNTGPGASRATIGRAGNSPPGGSTPRGTSLVPVEPLPGSHPQSAQQTANSWDDPWARDPWAQPPHSAPAGQAPDTRNNVATTRDAAAEWQMDTQPTSAPPHVSAGQLVSGGSNSASSGAGLDASAPHPQTSVPAAQPPWLPLLLVSLSLMGSLSANLFLGWSYLDARQKYRSLVRKTADTFRRATNAAA